MYRPLPKAKAPQDYVRKCHVGAHIKGDIMINNTTTNETTNLTELEPESGMLESLLDMLTSSPELILMAALMLAMGAYIVYTQPAVKALVMGYIGKHDDEINALLDTYLTKAQTKAYEKLDEVAQKHVKDAMLRNVIVSAWDQNDDKFVAVIKAEAKDAMACAKALDKSLKKL